MSIQVTNTLTRKKEPFVPVKAGEARMYVCGPTVYNYLHIGNARPCIFFDVVRRFLQHSGYKVTLVMNYTDVDDKIINRSYVEKISAKEVSEKYIAAFLDDMKAIGVRPPDEAPKVSEYIPQIVKFIEGLVANGMAYVSDDGEVFYSVRKFKGYGKLSGKNIDDLISGARVAPDEKKKDPLDFSLWKPRKKEEEAAWNSPWGMGRPGWHIECSAMALNTLGESFDLHGGGMDLIHPHHENEIAQSEGLTGKHFCKYWLHNNMLQLSSEKMSKSVGNILLIRDFVKKYTGEALRFVLLSAHYRSTIDFSEKGTRDALMGLHKIYRTLLKAEKFASSSAGAPATAEEKAVLEFGSSFHGKWKEAMEDDFNTQKAISIVFEYVRLLNSYFDKKGLKPSSTTAEIAKQFLAQMKTFSEVISLFGDKPSSYLEMLKATLLTEKGLSRDEIESAIKERSAARAAKDFKKSDAIRDSLLAKGVEIRDSGTTTEWDLI
jgi:cysteinyl-tRNA synthetase